MEGKFAMYLRKSRADIESEKMGEGETLRRHEHMLFDLAKRNDILPSQITIYKEIVSGENIQSRPEVQQLLRDVYKRTYAGVLVVEIERLARGNTKDQGEVAEAFKYSNTKIITIAKTYDPNNEFDEEYFEFGLFMSRREYKTIRRRMQAGLMESIKEGNYVGSRRPYGYDVVRNSKKDRRLVVNESEAKYVRMIFNWFTVDGWSSGQIARKLTELHVPTMTGNPEWHRGTVKDILQNIHYTGMVRWNRRKCSKERDDATDSFVKRKRRLTPDDYKVYQGKHEAIISSEQFNKAQTLFTGVVPVHAMEKVTNPLAGLMFCKDCGKPIILQTYPSNPNTTPRFTHRETVFCKKKSSAYDGVMAAIISALDKSVADCEMKIKKNEVNDTFEQAQTIIVGLESELAKQQQRLKKIYAAFEDGTYDSEDFIERRRGADTAISEIKKQIQSVKESTPEPVDYAERIIQLHKMIDTVKSTKISAKDKNLFLKDVIERIEYDVKDLGRNKGSQPLLDVYLK